MSKIYMLVHIGLFASLAGLTGCANDPNAKYAISARGGWDNFRADTVPGGPTTPGGGLSFSDRSGEPLLRSTGHFS